MAAAKAEPSVLWARICFCCCHFGFLVGSYFLLLFFAFCFLAKFRHTNRNVFPRRGGPCWGNTHCAEAQRHVKAAERALPGHAGDWCGDSGERASKERAEGLPDQQPNLTWIQTMWTKFQARPTFITSVALGGFGPEPDHVTIATGHTRRPALLSWPCKRLSKLHWSLRRLTRRLVWWKGRNVNFRVGAPGQSPSPAS